jgi:hypothetical protein
MQKQDNFDFYTEQPYEFESRDEALFFFKCVSNNIKCIYHPPTIRGRFESWRPDFYLEDYKAFVDTKPLVFWHETKRIKRVTIDAIQEGQRFWVWLVEIRRNEPRIIEWTWPKPSDAPSMPIEEQMKRFWRRRL